MRFMPLVLVVGSSIAFCLPSTSAEARHRRFDRHWGWGGSFYGGCCPDGGFSYASPMYSSAAPGMYASNYAAPAYDVAQSCQPSYSTAAPQPYAAGYGPQAPPAPTDIASSGPQAAPNAVTVGAYDNYFEPKTVHVQPGTKIDFVNHGQHPHTVTLKDGRWCSGDIQPGATYSATFQYAGTYNFYCRHHTRDRMELTVIVGHDAPQPSQTATGSQAAPRY